MLQYKQIGYGNPVVLLHGFLESSAVWAHIAKELSKTHCCIMPDLPGHGLSVSNRETEGMRDMANDVFELLDHLNVYDCDVIGHSMGGYVGTEMVRLNKQRVSSLCLLNSHAEPDTEVKKRDRNRVIEVVKERYTVFLNEAIPNLFADENKTGLSELIESLIQTAGSFPKEGIISCIRGLRDRPGAMDFLKGSTYVRFVAGSADTTIPIDMIREQAARLNADLEVIDGVGHMAYFEDPETTLKALNDFLNR